ncbi:uncharacterized protein Fot_06001 [Forsythia ovata]|uniref:Uncharacterized protein n=1 Tax=Forsythia ovata TaxID=205694 RepID=A0ABD1WRQ7_9LAMI
MTSFAPPLMKRAKACLQGLSPRCQVTNSPAKNLAILGFAHNANGVPQPPLVPNLITLKCGLDSIVTTPADPIALPVFRCSTAQKQEEKKPEIDLNMAMEDSEELDFMPQLKETINSGVMMSPVEVEAEGGVRWGWGWVTFAANFYFYLSTVEY